MKISACVIVKNEEKNIVKWLASMEGLADEMIVVDTGSTDRTKEIAIQAGAVVLDFPWQNDFSAAKNFAIKHAKGAWIAFLDADEYFSSSAVKNLRKYIASIDLHRDIVAVACRLVNIDEDNNNRFISTFLQIRIFRNLSKLRYMGAVHEALTIPKGKKVEATQDFTIYHTGYSASIIKKKLRRNLEMLQKKFAKKDGQKSVQDERYLMDIWYGLEEYSKAMEAAKNLLAHDLLEDDLRGRAYETLVSVCVKDNYPETYTLECFAEAVKACPYRVDFLLMKGLYLFGLKDYLQAEQELQQGIFLYYNRTKDYSNIADVADNAERLIPYVQLRLAEICQMKFQVEKACEHYILGLSAFMYNDILCCSFVRFLKKNNISDVDIIEQLNHIYDKKKDAEFLVKSLLCERSAGRVVLYYAEQGHVALSDKLKYRLNGNWYAAAEADARELDRNAGILFLAEENGVNHAKTVLQELYAGNYPKWKSILFIKRLQRMREELSAEV